MQSTKGVLTLYMFDSFSKNVLNLLSKNDEVNLAKLFCEIQTKIFPRHSNTHKHAILQ